MNIEQEAIVARLQDNLFTLRQLAGWSAIDLSKKLDVTRQTIYNLERGKPKMSLVQYLAIRKLLEIEIEEQQDNKALAQAVDVLLDKRDIPEEELRELQIKLKTITKGMSKTSDRSIALQLVAQTVGLAVPAIAAGLITKSPYTGAMAGLTILDLISGGTGGKHDDKE